jgi:hypothetical protein
MVVRRLLMCGIGILCVLSVLATSACERNGAPQATGSDASVSAATCGANGLACAHPRPAKAAAARVQSAADAPDAGSCGDDSRTGIVVIGACGDAGGANLGVDLGIQIDHALYYDRLDAGRWAQAMQPHWFRLHAGSYSNDAGRTPVLPSPPDWDFTELDKMVNAAVAVPGVQPILDVQYPPPSFWDCKEWQDDGALLDRTYADFADYMSKLVAY